MYDITIQGGTLIDPETKMSHRADIALRDGFIAALGENLPARTMIDAKGLAVCPGFIDPHCHCDGVTAYDDVVSCAKQSLAQGVTTMINGNCGVSVEDVGSYFARRITPCVNVMEFLGASTLRAAAGIYDIYRPADAGELAEMRAQAARAMQEGACGISFGLGYVPGITLEEAVALAEVAAQYGRVVAIDTRMETPDDLNSLQQAIDISRRAQVRVQVSHFVYQYGEGVMTQALEMMDKARAAGVDIHADSGMYVWWATGMGAEMFRESFMEANPDMYERLLVATGKYAGEHLDRDLYRLMRERHSRETVICKTGIEASIYEALEADFIMPSSDTAPYPPGQGHPQIAGSFARFFAMCRERSIMPLEEAVYRATLLPAQTFSIHDRGRLKPGCRGDIVVFDPQAIEDRARFTDEGAPDALPIGIKAVCVNGAVIYLDGIWQDLDAGMALRAGTHCMI